MTIQDSRGARSEVFGTGQVAIRLHAAGRVRIRKAPAGGGKKTLGEKALESLLDRLKGAGLE